MSARDIIVTTAAVFAIAVVMVFSFLLFSNFYAELKVNPVVNSSVEAVAALEGAEDNFLPAHDYVIFVMFMAFLFMVLISSWMIGAQPVYLFFYVLIGGFAVYLSMAFSNAWEQMFTDPTLLAVLSDFPLSNNIMSYLPHYVTAVFILGIFVMFAKPFAKGEK